MSAGVAPAAADERRHPAGGAGWSEAFSFSLCDPSADLGATVRLVFHPAQGRAWYVASVLGVGRPLVTVIDLDVPLPSASSSLEIRTSGLWADHNVETALEHVSLGLEAFGVALDDPAAVFNGAYGDRTPVGFDLEWETDGPIDGGPGRYDVACRAHGEILLGDEVLEVDGPGFRSHSWGPTAWWGPGWCRLSVRLSDGEHLVVEGDLDDLVPGCTLVPVAGSPVALPGPDGQDGIWTQNLVRLVAADGEPIGSGWLDTLVPQR